MLHRPQASRASEVHSAGNAALSCGHSRPALNHAEDEDQSCGAVSPRAARSQISTAVSFEGARPAGSVAVAARSTGGESAHSFADHEGENSSVLAAGPAGHQLLAQPTTSLLSTAMRHRSPPPRAPGSPELYRASSVVSYAEAGHHNAAQRAGTPASVYAQGRIIPPPTTRASSPVVSRADEQESESEGGRHSRNSNIQHLPSRSGNYEAAAPFLEVAQKLSSHISGRLSLDPPRKRAKTASPLHSVAAGVDLPEVIGTLAGGEADAQSSRRHQIHLRKSPSKQAESVPVGEASPRSAGLASAARNSDSLQGCPSNLPRVQRSVRQGRARNPFLQQTTLQDLGLRNEPLHAEPLVVPGLGHDLHPAFNPFHSQRVSGKSPLRPLPAAAEPHAASGHRRDVVEGAPTWEGFPPERSPAASLQHKAGYERRSARATTPQGSSSMPVASVHPLSHLSPKGSARVRLEGAPGEQGGAMSREAGDPIIGSQRSLLSGPFMRQQSLAQGGLTPADSVLGELQVGDVSENNTQINNLRSLQSTLSENGMHIPDQAHAASHRAPSFQASIVPNASAYGEAAAALGLDLIPERLASAASHQQNSQIAIQFEDVERAGRPASIKTRDVVEGRKPSKHSTSQRAQSHQAAAFGAAAAEKLMGPVQIAGGESQLGDELLERQMQRSQQPSHGHIATDKADDLLNDGNELPAVLSEAAPRQSLPSLLEGFPPEGHAHQAHSYSAEIPAVAVVDHEPNGPADSSDMVVQSHPNPDADPEARAPRPALTVFMQEGLLGPGNEPDDGAAWPLRQELASKSPSRLTNRCSSEAKSVAAGNPPSGRLRSETAKRRKLLEGQSPKTVASS